MSFTAVDLSLLSAPDVVEQIDFEAVFAAMLADLQARDPTFTALVESDPAYKILEVAAYRETLVRQRVNEAAKAIMLAYATGADLDQIGANFNVQRLVLDPGDPNDVPPVPPTYESDTELRRRIQLSFEGFSTAGPRGAYIFHALGADPDVLDASVQSPVPGEVLVTVLSRQGDGTADPALVLAVAAVLSADDVRPLTDQVTVQGATIVTYTVEAVLTLYSGPDPAVVLATAQAALDAYVAARQRIGQDVTRSGIFAALHQPGVQNVALAAPAADLVIGLGEASFCTGTDVTVGGVDA